MSMLFTKPPGLSGLSACSVVVEYEVALTAPDGTVTYMTAAKTIYNVTAIHAPTEHTFMDARRAALAQRQSGEGAPPARGACGQPLCGNV